jgi:hypothetical protein
MGQVVPFIARVRDSGDWTAAERARLDRLADQLSASGVHVDVVYGATDAGDPWCVIKDENEEVLIHIARIGGAFVIHSELDGTFHEGDDLQALLRAHLAALGEAEAADPGVVLPFQARQAQTILALLIAAAFVYETAAAPLPAHAAAPTDPPPPPHDPPPPSPDLHAGVDERETAAHASALAEPHHAAPAALAPSEPPPPIAAAPAHEPPPPLSDAPAPRPPAAPLLEPAGPAPAALDVQADRAPDIVGTAGDDSLVGTARSERLLGGEGADTLDGGGGHDTLDGGAGDDRLELTPEAVAIGGAGADTFVVHAPAHGGHPDTLLGVILDFASFEGDRVVTAHGETVWAPRHPAPDGPAVFSFTKTTAPAVQTAGQARPEPVQTLARTEVDVDHDGVADGYLLVVMRTQPPDTPPDPLAPPSDTTLQVLGRDPERPDRLLVDLNGDGHADGEIGARFADEDTIIVTSHSLTHAADFAG